MDHEDSISYEIYEIKNEYTGLTEVDPMGGAFTT